MIISLKKMIKKKNTMKLLNKIFKEKKKIKEKKYQKFNNKKGKKLK